MKKLIMLAALIFVLAPFSAVFGQEGPVPFPECTGEAYTVRDTPADFYYIDQTEAPFVFDPIRLDITGPFGIDGAPIPIQINNLGYRSTDNLLYAVANNERTTASPRNYGIIQIDFYGSVFPFPLSTDPPSIPLPTNVRFLAGDVTPDGATMYINTYPAGDSGGYMYVVDLATGTVGAVTLDWSSVNQAVYVADWAVNPADGNLYGAAGSLMGNIGDEEPPPPEVETAPVYKLDPATGEITFIGYKNGLPYQNSNYGDGQYYGGAWFGGPNDLFVYRNNDEIYSFNLFDSFEIPAVFFEGAAGSSELNDAAACIVAPEPGPEPDPEIVCTYTQGYWKNHEETWGCMLPDDPFFDTGKTWMEVLQASPKGGNAYYILAHQYIAAMLNVCGALPPVEIEEALEGAAELLSWYGAGREIPKQNELDRASAINLAYILDQFNNGRFEGIPHCDDEPTETCGDEHCNDDCDHHCDGHCSKNGDKNCDGHCSKNGSKNCDEHCNKNGSKGCDGHCSKNGSKNCDEHCNGGSTSKQFKSNSKTGSNSGCGSCSEGSKPFSYGKSGRSRR